MRREPQHQGGAFSRAVLRLSSPLDMKNPRFLKRAVLDLRGVHPDMATFAQAFLRDCHRRCFPILCSELLRDGDRQDLLFKQGFSKARAGESAHNFGMAGDFFHWKRGWDLSPEEWLILGEIGMEVARKTKIPMNWGGDDVQREKIWPPKNGDPRTYDNFRWDPAHFEMANWRSRIVLEEPKGGP
nr:MAG: hypothetical protein [Microvirus sp.]